MLAQLFRMFVDIALWRRGPQDLPASPTLAWLAALSYALATAIKIGMRGWNFQSGFLLILLNLIMQAAWLWGLLVFFARAPRFLQSISAFLGVGALIAALDVVISAAFLLTGFNVDSPRNPWPLFQFGLLLLLLGRILQQALERSLFMSMSLTYVIMLTVYVVSRGLLPGM